MIYAFFQTVMQNKTPAQICQMGGVKLYETYYGGFDKAEKHIA